ncbi:MAG: PRC-barrel domain-containing protein [Selenomonadaceae bacterium]|nr:PRC-barrel domain-containing protein [Selenomonadaceae bacterium]
MKKSVEILGLPVISITEGRELGMSKTLLIDARNGKIAAVTIEDEDWYRGVKLIPYESVIAIGDDAVTVTNSENILKLDEAGDYENLLDENIRIIDTKAITKTGTIQGKISELFIGDDGKIEKCEITAPDGTTTEIMADQISIFGKQVTVIDPDGEKKTEFVAPPTPAAKPAPEPAPAEPAAPAPAAEAAPVESPAAESPAAAPAEEAAAPIEPKAEEPPKAEEAPAPKTEPEPAPEAKEDPKKEAPKAAPAEEKPEPKKEAPKAAKPAAPKAAPAADAAKQAADKATEERHRRFLLGKKAARTIKMDNGIVIVEAGADITEEVLQKAKLANKFIELSMNVQ